MTSKIKPETWVGLFLLVGLSMIIGLILFYGDFKDASENSYPIKIEFKDAGTLIPGSVVRLGGAVVGKITYGPQIMPSGDRVYVDVLISKNIRIQKGSSFQIAMQNILGDSYIEVTPPAKPTNEYIEADSTIIGNSQNDLSKLKNNAVIASDEAIRLLRNINENFSHINDAVMHISQAANDLSGTVNKINHQVLSQHNIESINSLMSDVKKTGASLPTLAQEASQTLESIRTTIHQAEKSFQNIDTKIAKLDQVIDDIPQISSRVNKTVTNIEKISNDILAGKGLIGMLLFDKQFRLNAQEFIRNLRDYGILRYRNPNEPEIQYDPRTGYSGSRR